MTIEFVDSINGIALYCVVADGEPGNKNQGLGEFDPSRGSHFSGGDLQAVIVVGAFNTPDRFAEYSPRHKAASWRDRLQDPLSFLYAQPDQISDGER